MKYGIFDYKSIEYVITDPATPRAFDNFLWNQSIFANVQQTGVGYTDYQIDNKEMTKLSTGIGRICDFDVYGRDSFMNRLIYIRDNETGQYWNLGWEPVKKEYEKYNCRHGLGYTIIENQTDGIKGQFRVFIPEGDDPVELWTINLESIDNLSRDISVFIYVQISFKYMWGFNSYGDMIYRNSFFSEDNNMMVFTKHPFIKPHNYQTGFLAADKKIAGYDGSKDAFVGRYNNLKEPKAVVKGRCNNIEGSADATIAALQFDISLNDNEEELNLVFGVSTDINNASQLKNKYLYNMEEAFQTLKDKKRGLKEKNYIESPDNLLNMMVNNWNKQQALYGATWCRWGWMGYRDIVQHGYGVSNFAPERTKEIILQALKYQYKNGLALRGWNPIDKKPYSDSSLWLVFTLTEYLKETGEYNILEKTVPYYDGGNNTVIEHIDNALNFLEKNKGEHGLTLIKFGDWNDSLTGIGKNGKGESVWLSMAYAEALRRMSRLSEFLNLKDKQIDYQERYTAIIDAINKHAWNGEWYIRGFCDDGTPIGSKENPEGKIYLNVQSWALICGAATGKRAKKAIEAVDKYLSTDLGYQLIYPTYKTFNPVIGRVTAMEPGIAENGTIYTHGNAFMLKGLYNIGKAEKAYQLYKKMSPAYISGENDPKNKMPAYIYANCYFGPDHRNNKYQMEFTWITGSIAWIYNTMFDDMLGVKRDYGGLYINPQLPQSWDELKAVRYIRSKKLDIIIKNNSSGEIKIILNGNEVRDNFINYKTLKNKNIVEIIT